MGFCTTFGASAFGCNSLTRSISGRPSLVNTYGKKTASNESRDPVAAACADEGKPMEVRGPLPERGKLV